MRLNGHPKMQETFARVSGYVEQTGLPLSTSRLELACGPQLSHNSLLCTAGNHTHVVNL